MKLNYKSKTILFFTFFIIIYCNAQAPVIEWQKCFGGTFAEGITSINKTSDGGYIVTGSSESNNGDVSGNHGYSDCWVVKLNSIGIIEWQKCLGGTNGEEAYSIIQATDGGYIVVGSSQSNNGDVSENHGYSDNWVVKLNSTGIIEWQKCLGGTDNDSGLSIIQTTNGSYIIAGETYSNDGNVLGNHGSSDGWVVKLNSIGIIEWQKCLGGTDYDTNRSIVQTTDGGYIVAGFTFSNDGDVSGNQGIYNAWAVKLSGDNLTTTNFTQETTFTLYPNPTKDNITLKLDYFSPSQEITITDLLGKTIHKQKLDGLTTNLKTGSFKKGVYILTLFSKGNKTTKKFIVE